MGDGSSSTNALPTRRERRTRGLREGEVESANDEIGDAKGHPVTPEGARRGEGYHEHRPDRGENREPDGVAASERGRTSSRSWTRRASPSVR